MPICDSKAVSLVIRCTPRPDRSGSRVGLTLTAVPLGQICGAGHVCADHMHLVVVDEGELLVGLCAEEQVEQRARCSPVPERLHHVLQQLLHVLAQIQQHVTRLTLAVRGQQLQRLMGRVLTFQTLGFGSRSLRKTRM